MSEASKPSSPQPQPAAALPEASAFVHRVCIQCNNMFRVLAAKFDAKHCPNCHKG